MTVIIIIIIIRYVNVGKNMTKRLQCVLELQASSEKFHGLEYLSCRILYKSYRRIFQHNTTAYRDCVVITCTHCSVAVHIFIAVMTSTYETSLSV